MRLQASALVVLLVGMLALSVVSMMPLQSVYAQEASATLTYESVSAGGNRACTGIAEDSDNNVWLVCNSNTTTTGDLRLYVISSAGSVLDDIQVSSNSNGAFTRLYYEGTLVGGFETVTMYNPGTSGGAGIQHQLRTYYYNTTASAIQSSGTHTVSSCTDVGMLHLNRISDNFYFGCNDASDQVRIVSNTLFQFNSYSGIKTGSPTCTNLNTITMYSSLRGVAVCDNTTLIQFSLSGSTITKGDSITTTQSFVSAKMLVVNNKIFALTGGDLYVIPFNTSTNIFTGGDNSETLALSANIADMIIGAGGAGLIHAVDSGSNAYFMFNTAVDDPTATLVFTAISGLSIGTNSKITAMVDNESFMFSQGSGGTVYSYFTVTDIVSGIIAGLSDFTVGDLNIPFGRQSCYDTNGDGLYDSCVTVRDSAPAGVYCTDSDGDGVYNDCAPTMGSVTTSGPALVALFTGIKGEGANVLLGMIAPFAFLLLAGATAATGKVQLPMFVFGIAFLGGVGVSVAIGWLESWWLVVGIMGFATSFAGEIKKIFG